MKTVKLDLRLSVEEKEALKSRAKEAGLGVSEYVRNWINGDVMTEKKEPVKEVVEEDPEIPEDIEERGRSAGEGAILEFCSRDFEMQFDDEDMRALKKEANEIAKYADCKVDFNRKYFYRVEDGRFKTIASWE
jgi:hypothetical protein